MDEYEKQKIELELIKKQMEEEKQKTNKMLKEQKDKYEKKIKSEMQLEQTRRQMKDLKKDVESANRIAKFMSKDISFTAIYVSKFEEESVYSASGAELGDMPTEI